MENSGEIEKVDKGSISNRLLLSYARLSPNEIAKKTGFSPIEAAERISALLDDRDYLTQMQQEQLLILDMQELIDDAKQRMSGVSDEYYADIAAVVVRSMTAIGARMDSQRKLIKHNIEDITEARAALYGRSFDIALWHVIDKLMIEHSDISKEEVRALVREGMMLASQSLAEHVNQD